MRNKNCFKMLFGGALALVMASTSVFGTVGPARVEAANDPYSEIQVAAFWGSDKDNTDTVYFSTDGLNFHEICEAFSDIAPDDASDSRANRMHYTYRMAGDKVLQLDANGNYIPFREDGYVDVTLHDPSVFYYNGYFWMASGYATGYGSARRVVVMLSYSKDLIHWSSPGSGSETNIALTELPPVDKAKTIYYSENEWDMVAPEIYLDEETGKMYVTFCIGYFALFHTNDTRENKLAYDEMFPYIAEITGITMPQFSDTSDPSTKYCPDPSRFPEASWDMKVTYSDAIPVTLPCMDTTGEYYRAKGSYDHIDGSIFKEDGYYYYSIKENGVTNEIYRTKDLSKASDPKAWEEVCYDVITGYEGPCLNKFGGEYFMYVDRLSTFYPTDLNGVQATTPYGSEGIHVGKASVGNTGKLDGYTGWLEENVKEIKAYRLLSKTETKPTRHGTVITVTGEAAKTVRDAAKSVGYTDADLYGTVNQSDWAHTGWYQKESFLDPSMFGLDKAQFHKYYYENDVRIGTSLTTSLGEQRDMNGNPYFFQPDASDAERDGMMLCAVIDNGWSRGEPIVTVPVDWDYYKKVGAAVYGNANSSWATYIYDNQGMARKCTDTLIYRWGETDDWYRLDPESGRTVKGAFGYVNDAGYTCFMWFDPNTGKQVRGTYGTYETYQSTGSTDGFYQLEVNRRIYYIDMYGSVWYKWYNYDNGNAYGPYLAAVEKKGQLPEVEYHSPSLDVWQEDGHPTAEDGNSWYKPQGEDGLWYWYEGGVRQGTSTDPAGVYGYDAASQKAINRGREIMAGSNWYWLDSDRQGARAVAKEVWVPYIFQDEGKWTAEGMKSVAAESDPCMQDFVFECMVNGTGKWVRYDGNGEMLKGWVDIVGELAQIYPSQEGNRYYYDTKTGLMAKGWITMDGVKYYFDPISGVLTRGPREIDGVLYNFDVNTGALL